MTIKDAFTIQSSALPAATRLAGFHGSEGLSRLYTFEVFLIMTENVGHDFNLENAVGAKATLRLEPSEQGPGSTLNGVLASIELVSDFATRSVFRAVLVPRLWHLTQSLHSRVFTQQTIPAILEAVLQSGGLSGDDYSLRLLGSYATQEHVCQYQESDFDFISRWMEREGLYYYFEQGDGKERLIITDTNSSHKPLGARPVRYFPQPEGTAHGRDTFRAFTCRHSSLPASVRLKDYDYAKPAFDVSGAAPVSASGVGQISVHGARFFSPGEGAHLAQVKAQGLKSGSVVYQGFGTAPSLRSGYTFELEEHPRAAFNTSYLVTELEHWNNQLPGLPELAAIIPWDEWYRMEVTAVTADVQYRAPQRTPWPRIYGTEHAVIDGPSVSEYAQIDSHGRYAVKFQFDESDLTGGKASTWVRMLQPHGGGIEGFHFPLRAGTEVACSFAGGDPDRPSIVGVAPNALTPSPVTSGNNTRNVLQTGGRNRFELEDKAGLERITLSTPHTNTYLRMGAPNDDHNLHLHTDGHSIHDTAGNLDIQVGANFQEFVVGTTTETYQGAANTEYKDTVTVKYDNTKDETVVGNLTEKYNAKLTQTVGESVSQTIGTTFYQKVGGGGSASLGAGDAVLYDVKGDWRTVVDGNYKVKANKNSHDETVGDFSSTVRGSSTSIVHGARTSTTEGASTSHVVGGSLSLTEGISISNMLGGSVSATEGIAINGVLGVRVNLTNGPQIGLNIGTTIGYVGGIVEGLIMGGKVDMLEGFKVEMVTGVQIKDVTMEAVTRQLKAEMTKAKISRQEVELVTRALGVTMADVEVVA
jgi:type VI secretion system secreted protein VgrG